MTNVQLRLWTESDDDTYLNIVQGIDYGYDTEALRCHTCSEAQAKIRSMLHDEQHKQDLYRAVVVEGCVVGAVQVQQQSGISCRDGQIGCMIASVYSGLGFGTEAVRQMVSLAFSERDYNRLTAQVYAPNRASSRMLEKAGFQFEFTMRHLVWKDGQTLDALVYGLLKDNNHYLTNHNI